MPILRPLDLICPASAHKRDTLKNIRDTGEFVVNLARTDAVDKVIPTAKHTPPEVDEFSLAGIEEKPSELIKAPGMAGCYGWIECCLHKLYEEEKYVLVMGQALRVEVADDALAADGSLDPDKARPLMMTGLKKGMSFCTLRTMNRFEPFSAMFADGRDPLAKKYED